MEDRGFRARNRAMSASAVIKSCLGHAGNICAQRGRNSLHLGSRRIAEGVARHAAFWWGDVWSVP
jgi:hypothetical protein